jgi:hypothetical protein
MIRILLHRYRLILSLLLYSHVLVHAQQTTLLWRTSADYHIHSVASTNDVNGDGYADVFAGSADNRVYCFSGGGATKGSIIWSWNYGADVWTVASLPDINGDGADECLVGTAENRAYCMTGKPQAGLTEILWSHPINGDVFSVATIGDVNYDGYDDCLIGGGDDFVRCLSGKWGLLLWSYQNTFSGAIKTVASIPDVNGDGLDDCLAGGENNKVMCISGGSSGTGSLIWSYRARSTILSVAAVEDVTGDGFADCFAGGEDNYVYCISGIGFGPVNPIWSYKTGSTVKAVSSIADANSDGRPDCLAGSEDNKIYCLSGNGGTPIWSYTTGGSVFGVAAITDINGNGGEDCIAGGDDDNVYCIEGKSSGTGQVHWSYPAGGAIKSVAVITDISGNGVPDVLAGSTDSYVYALEGGQYAPPTETISNPSTPTGASTGKVGQSLIYTTGGSMSNLGHTVEYRFDWGDGNISGWGSASRSHTYTIVGNYTIKAQARCQSHTSIVSNWSSGKTVNISGHTLSVTISGQGTVSKSPNKAQYNHNENVALTASPYAGYGFDHWGGNLSGSANPAILTMNGDKSVIVYFTQTAETVSNPSTPTGSSTGKVGQSLTYTTGGSTSNLGHAVQYRFDWGDGNITNWGSATQSHAYTTVNTYNIKAQARCQTHTGIVSGWSGTKSVTVSGHTLTVTISGQGTVSNSPNKTQYNHNENVTLTASPSAGYRFDRWEGALSGSTNPSALTMNGDKTVTAYFTQTTETVSIPTTPTGASTGKVGQSLTYTTGGSTSNLGHAVEYRFDWGDGSFSNWGSTSQNHIYTTVGAFSVKAQARCQSHTGVVSDWSGTKGIAVAGHTLNVNISGQGTISKSPNKAQYNHNENVTLTATPSAGYQFDRWEGSLSGSANPATLTMNGDKTVTAFFTQTTETVSNPNTPTGPSSGKVGQSLIFITSGSLSNLGHAVEYRFDWGDGSFSSWGSASQTHTFIIAGTHNVKAQTRCQTHTGVVSSWSLGRAVNVSGHTLTVTINGQGTVSKSPNKTQYNHYENVTLTAAPYANYQFDHWGGNLSGNTNPAILSMDGNKTVTAYFTQTAETIYTPGMPSGPIAGKVGQSLTFSTSGAVSSLGHTVEYRFDWGDGSFSNWGSTSQSHTYTVAGTHGVRVQARCQIHTGVVSSWSAARNVAVSGHTLTVTISGQGTVTNNPNKNQYNHNESVTLIAVPSDGYLFNNWGADMTGSSNPASLVMNTDKNVIAFFTQTNEIISRPNRVTGPSSGSVGQNLTFSTGGALSNLGHDVEYRFDWGDGSLSDWGGFSQSHAYDVPGFNLVIAQARCALHPSVVSDWSLGAVVRILNTGVEHVESNELPDGFRLSQNYPNPFNGETWITYQVPQHCNVKVEVFSVHGEWITTLVNTQNPTGIYRVNWDGRNQHGVPMPSGIYLYRFTAGQYQSMKTMLYMK